MILAAAILGMRIQENKVYDNQTADIKFEYPAAWTLKRDRLYDELTFKVNDKTVIVQLMSTEMDFPKEEWQSVNREVNQQNNREVIRQWEEELLGVPLLLMRVRDSKPQEPQIILSGLLYGARKQKFLFRLYAPESVAESAEQQWHTVLLSSNTLSGKLPSEALPAENPSATIDTGGGEVRVEILKPATGEPSKAEWGTVSTLVDEQHGLHFYSPEGWTFKENSLSNGAIRVNLVVGLGSDQVVRTAWLKQSGEALDRLAKVTSRIESEPAFTKAAFKGGTLIRRGVSEDKEIVQWLAYGASNGNFFILEWSGTPAEFEAAKDSLAQLHQYAAVAPQ